MTPVAIPINETWFCGGQHASKMGLHLEEGGIWNNGSAKRLPPGYFLICGDRAWGEIPAKAVGDLCYLGRLTLFTPSIRNLKKHQRSKQAITHHELTPDC